MKCLATGCKGRLIVHNSRGAQGVVCDICQRCFPPSILLCELDRLSAEVQRKAGALETYFAAVEKLTANIKQLRKENSALTSDVAAKHHACVEHRRLQRLVHSAPSDQTVGELRIAFGENVQP